MTWPISQIADSSAAAAYGRICSDAFAAQRNAISLRTSAAGGTLTLIMLRSSIPTFKAARVFLNANDGVAGLQAYARLVSGNPAFDLTTESAALKALYSGVVTEGRALYNTAIGGMAADGTVTDALDTLPANLTAALQAACAALEAGIV